MNTCTRLLAASLAILLSAAPAPAHHAGSATVSSGTLIQWRGAIVKVSWDGPHVMYLVEVEGANGAVERWQVLGGSPTILARRGIFKGTLAAGDNVTVAGYLNVHSRIISPVYLSPSSGRKFFVGYFTSDEGLDLTG